MPSGPFGLIARRCQRSTGKYTLIFLPYVQFRQGNKTCIKSHYSSGLHQILNIHASTEQEYELKYKLDALVASVVCNTQITRSMYTSCGWCVNWWNIKWRGREWLGQMELGLSAKQCLTFSSCVLWTVSMWHPALLIFVWCQLLSLPWSTYLVWATLDSLVVSLLVISTVKK